MTMVCLTLVLTLLTLQLQCALAQSWKHYPLTLESNAALTFPGIEGQQNQYMSDSWFLTANVVGDTTGKHYQLVTIFDRNDITAVALDFYQVSMFDLGAGAFRTYTEYDLPGVSLLQRKFSAATGGMDVAFAGGPGPASWRNAKDSSNQSEPFVYVLRCPGVDHVTGEAFAFNITADMRKAPVAVGAGVLRGEFIFYAQKGTLSYFQPGPGVDGTVTFGGVTERVRGSAGWIDRQTFPLYSGIFTPTGRQHSHLWMQINLASGEDLSVWRQFDRVRNNSVIADSGVTVSRPLNGAGEQTQPNYQDGLGGDMTVEYVSFAKYPRAQSDTLLPPPSGNMYLPSHVVIRSKGLNMALEGRYTTEAPVAQLPIEYFEGPALWSGTFEGRAVNGVGILESTFALYRDWELAWVLRESVAHLPESMFGTISRGDIVKTAQMLQTFVSDDPLQEKKLEAEQYSKNEVRPAIETVKDDVARRKLLEMVDDFDSSLALVLQF